MELHPDEIYQLASTIWEAMLNLPIEPAVPHYNHCGTRSMAACIQITGAWNGAILLDCPAGIARLGASVMFAKHVVDVQVTDMQDAIAELVNMIGGNFKGLLPEGCHLSLPNVVEGGDYSARVPGSRKIGCVDFSCRGQNVSITILEKIQHQVAA